MSKNLPEKSFEWMEEEELKRFEKDGGAEILKLKEEN